MAPSERSIAGVEESAARHLLCRRCHPLRLIFGAAVPPAIEGAPGAQALGEEPGYGFAAI